MEFLFCGKQQGRDQPRHGKWGTPEQCRGWMVPAGTATPSRHLLSWLLCRVMASPVYVPAVLGFPAGGGGFLQAPSEKAFASAKCSCCMSEKAFTGSAADEAGF